jgi:FAD/FMN-containing dehydrogenase
MRTAARVRAAAAQGFGSCVTGSSGATLRTPNQPDFYFHVSRGLDQWQTPSYIAAVYSAQDVQAVMNCANQYGVKVCPRSGGHDFTGSSSCSGVMVDVRGINQVGWNAGFQQITVGLGNTLGEMFLAVQQLSGGSRIIGIGLCPSVGTGGYIVGGGHSPYSGLTGLTCDSLASIKIVQPDGSLVTASSSSNTELFWASCGGGGSAFGIAVEATLNTYDAGVFNNNVFFRYQWPQNVAGQVISGWADWNQDSGNSWMRLEANIGSPLQGYGVCWNAGSVAACEGRLSQQAWFNTPGRSTVLAVKASRVGQFQAFIGPAGDWASKQFFGTDQDALANKLYLDASNGPNRVYGSSFLSWPGGQKPSAGTLQAAVDAVSSTNGGLVDWIVLQFNPWKGQAQGGYNNAFAHRKAGLFVELIGQSKTGTAGLQELRNVEGAFKTITRQWLSGVYVSYPEFNLATQDYQYLYWGQNLQRLAYLRGSVDPNNRMARYQAMPSGKLSCPGNLAVISPSGTTRQIQVTGYNIGQMAGMIVEFGVGGGCRVNIGASQNANVYQSGSNYGAEVHNNAPFTISLTGSNTAACTISTVTVNGISCSGGGAPAPGPAPAPAPAPGPAPGPGPAPAPAPTGNCRAAGERCIGAAGFPAVQWLTSGLNGGPCCAGTCSIQKAGDWGTFCSGGIQAAPVPAPAGTCRPSGERCIGASGFPTVAWIPCCSGACSATKSNDWGTFCR